MRGALLHVTTGLLLGLALAGLIHAPSEVVAQQEARAPFVRPPPGAAGPGSRSRPSGCRRRSSAIWSGAAASCWRPHPVFSPLLCRRCPRRTSRPSRPPRRFRSRSLRTLRLRVPDRSEGRYPSRLRPIRLRPGLPHRLQHLLLPPWAPPPPPAQTIASAPKPTPAPQASEDDDDDGHAKRRKHKRKHKAKEHKAKEHKSKEHKPERKQKPERRSDDDTTTTTTAATAETTTGATTAETTTDAATAGTVATTITVTTTTTVAIATAATTITTRMPACPRPEISPAVAWAPSESR